MQIILTVNASNYYDMISAYLELVAGCIVKAVDLYPFYLYTLLIIYSISIRIYVLWSSKVLTIYEPAWSSIIWEGNVSYLRFGHDSSFNLISEVSLAEFSNSGLIWFIYRQNFHHRIIPFSWTEYFVNRMLRDNKSKQMLGENWERSSFLSASSHC